MESIPEEQLVAQAWSVILIVTIPHSPLESYRLTDTQDPVGSAPCRTQPNVDRPRGRWLYWGQPVREGRLFADTAQLPSCQTRAICELRINGSVKETFG